MCEAGSTLTIGDILADYASSLKAQAGTFATAGFQNMELLNRSILTGAEKGGAVSPNAVSVRVFRMFFSFIDANEPGVFRAMFTKEALTQLLAPALGGAGGQLFSLRHILDFLAAHDGEASKAALDLGIDCDALLDGAAGDMLTIVREELGTEIDEAAGHFEKMHIYKACIRDILEQGGNCVLPFGIDPAQVLRDYQDHFFAFSRIVADVAGRRKALAARVEAAIDARLAPAAGSIVRAFEAYAAGHPGSADAVAAHFRDLEERVMNSRLAASVPGADETFLMLLCAHCEAILAGGSPISAHWRACVESTRKALLG